MVLEREAGEHFLRSKQATFPGKALAEMFEMKEGALGEEVARNILHIDGDDHRRLRNLVNPAFTPRAADRWRPVMRDFIAGLFEPIADAGGCEAVAALTKPYPAMTIATVVGAPTEDAERLADWSRWIQLQFDGRPWPSTGPRSSERARSSTPTSTCSSPSKRAEPGDDLLSTLIAARDGDDRLDDAELRNLVLNVLVGGVDTTQSQLAHALRLFAAHPDQWELLGARARARRERRLRGDPGGAGDPVHRADRRRGDQVPRRRLPRGHDRLRLRPPGQPRRGRRRSRPSTSPARTRASARSPSVPGSITASAPTSPAPSSGEALAYLARGCPASSSTGEPAYESVHGIYGLDRAAGALDVLSNAIGDLLPSALAVALSPIPIVAVILVLGAPRARTAGPAFALGWIAGLLAVSVIVVLVVGAGSDPDASDPGLNWFKIAIGVLFLAMAARQWRKRPGPGEEPEAPSWMATIETVTPGRAAVLGGALSGVNPKNLALTLTAAASIAEAGLDTADTAIAVAVFVVLGSLTVAGAVLFYLVDADRAARPLAAVRQFMFANNAVIMMVVLLLLGAKLLGDGLAVL